MAVRYKNYKNPWEDKEELKKIARAHTEEMEALYPEEIKSSIENSAIYGGPDKRPASHDEAKEPNIYFVNIQPISLE